MNIKRLKKLIEDSKLSKVQLSEQCGFTRVTLDKLLQGADVKLSTVESVAKVLNVPTSYLFSEEGIEQNEPLNDSGCIAKYTDVPGEGIPMIPLSAMAGALTDERTVIDFECERYIVPAFNGADFLIPVKGTSMEPTYKSGDIVACTKVPMRDLFFQWNHVYVIDTNQGPLIKRIKPGRDEGHILIVSDNKEYDPFELPYSSVNAVALVVGTIRLE